MGSVVALSYDDTFPVFGQILNILLVDVDKPYFVCEVFNTDNFDSHLHAYIVAAQSPTHITLCQQHQLLDHHTLGLYKLCLYDNIASTYCIVPKYAFVNDI